MELYHTHKKPTATAAVQSMPTNDTIMASDMPMKRRICQHMENAYQRRKIVDYLTIAVSIMLIITMWKQINK